MGFFDRVKATFDSGGIKVKLEVPNDFHWGEETIPVKVTLTGHKAEPRRVKELTFLLQDELESDKAEKLQSGESRYGRRVKIGWVREGVIELDPGETVTLDVPVVVAQDGSASASVGNEKVDKVIGVASMLGMVTNPSDIRSYQITVNAPVEGANRTKSHSRSIRQGGLFKVGKGGISLG